jgi:hypothetical protein
MARDVEKDYLAVCRGWPAEERFTIDHPLDGGPGKPVKKPATTTFERLATCELDLPSAGFSTSRYALLRAHPLTGRFRQIRRHLKHVSHHLIGDTSHGDGRHNRAFRMLGIHRMLLHARAPGLRASVTGARIEVRAPLDAEFAKAPRLFADVATLSRLLKSRHARNRRPPRHPRRGTRRTLRAFLGSGRAERQQGRHRGRVALRHREFAVRCPSPCARACSPSAIAA